MRTTKTPTCYENNKDPADTVEAQLIGTLLLDVHLGQMGVLYILYVGSVSAHHKEQKESVPLKEMDQKSMKI